MTSPSNPAANSGDGAFIGRREALEKLHALFKNEARLVTISGPEGIGKSRLAERFGTVHEHTFKRDGAGVVWTHLGEARTGDDVVSALLDALDLEISAPGRGDQVLTLAHLLGMREHVLIVLDDADRVSEALAKLLPVLMEKAPKAQFLVTSRAPLQTRQEVKLKLGPLRVPPKLVKDPDGIQRFEAIELFIERAREAVQGWTLKPQEARAVAEIVRRLGGVPLGIRIAAARLRSFSPSELLERLPARVELLERKARGGRHTLQEVETRQTPDRPAHDRHHRVGLAASQTVGAARAPADVSLPWRLHACRGRGGPRPG